MNTMLRWALAMDFILSIGSISIGIHSWVTVAAPEISVCWFLLGFSTLASTWVILSQPSPTDVYYYLLFHQLLHLIFAVSLLLLVTLYGSTDLGFFYLLSAVYKSWTNWRIGVALLCFYIFCRTGAALSTYRHYKEMERYYCKLKTVTVNAI